ncbi:MAG: hypothetical protein ABI920_16480 [Casimicrobiaceae bacterium]
MSALNVFGFLLPGRDDTDPLQNPRSAAAWLHDLPALDVMERQQQVMQAFHGMRQSQKPIDLPRINAIGFLDAALGADRRQLIKQYVENFEVSSALSERLWQAIQELTQAFIYAYRTAVDAALTQASGPRAKSALPALFARLIHFHGTDAKLRVFRFERWIPAKWTEVHELYERAVSLGIDRTPATAIGAGPNAAQWTVEQEFVNVLLIHQLNTGNLTPAELDWASAQLRGWSRRLALDVGPRSADGFYVRLSGKTGLVRRSGNESGSMLRYLDTTELSNQLDGAIISLRRAELADDGKASSINVQRLSILERVRPSVAPNLNAELRRDPRVPVQVEAKVRVGLSRICRDLTTESAGVPIQADATEHIEVFAVNDGSRPRRQVQDERDSVLASLSAFSEPTWQVKDRSTAGLRIAASGGIGQSLALGTLVAVRPSDIAGWMVGVVRRLNKVSKDDVEAGLAVIAERIVPVSLNARRDGNGGMEVDGLDTTTIGARFDGLYLPPPSRPERPLSVKTVIVPTTEYVDGRRIVLSTGRSVYTVALRTLIEQRADWTWCAIQIVEKRPRVQ